MVFLFSMHHPQFATFTGASLFSVEQVVTPIDFGFSLVRAWDFEVNVIVLIRNKEYERGFRERSFVAEGTLIMMVEFESEKAMYMESAAQTVR
ncbi:unnamed protein product [Vicia faba]|uniref:Uncharacterized protein n=1 Tax=Vicia faba TaxID=3906 RepID=A0AAV1AI24_VICFA|nr:unnamed protein product [Vicia faba]